MAIFVLVFGVALFTYVATFRSDFEDSDVTIVLAAVAIISIILIILSLL